MAEAGVVDAVMVPGPHRPLEVEHLRADDAIDDEDLFEAVDESNALLGKKCYANRLVVGELAKKHRPEGWEI